jgi:hypothetical protein
MQKRLKATVAFTGKSNRDPAAGGAALREAGYEVLTMPEEFRSLLRHPGDDYLEVTKCIAGDEYTQAIEMMDDVNAIVDRYGGMCRECGDIDEDHVPFLMLWTPDVPPTETH